MAENKKGIMRRTVWGRMARYTTVLAMAAVTAVAGSLTGCSFRNREVKLETGDISDHSVVMLVGDESVRFSEIKNYCYFLKCQYEGSFGEKLWEYPLGTSETIGDQAKQEIVNMITQVKIISSTAREQNVVLTADEQDEALQQAEELINNATEEDKEEYSLNVQEISEIYKENALANKMFYVATDDANTSVSDAEARQMLLQYMLIMTKGTDRNGIEISMDTETRAEAMERAKRLQKEAAGAEDFLALAEQNTDASQTEVTIGRGTDLLERNITDAALSMKTGEVSGVIEGEQGYYILYCVSEQDEDATRQRKEEIIGERQTAMFMEKYAQWMQDQDVDINQSFWNEFSI